MLASKSGYSTQTIRRAQRGLINTPTTLYAIYHAFNELAPAGEKVASITDLFPDFAPR